MKKTIIVKQINVQTGEELEVKETIAINEEEIAKQELQAKINQFNQYLKDTDWVSSYKLRHDLGLEIISNDSSKWLVISKRAEYISFLKDNQ